MRPTLQFGPFEADPQLGQLRKGGEPLHLQDQPFRLLMLLAERPGEVVSRDEIREALWSADTFVEFEHSLNTAVNRLRTALGDSAGAPKFVETVPRRGYRFIGTLEGPQRDTHDEGESEHDPWPRRYAVAGLALAALVIGGWFLRPGPEGPGGPLPQARQLTDLDGFAYCPTFSPDGSQVAFTWHNGDRNQALYVQSLSAPAPREIVRHADPVSNPSWSPNGALIAYAVGRSDNEGFEVRVISPSGAGDRRLAKFPGSMRGVGMPRYQFPLAWSPDSRFLVIEQGEPRELHLLDIGTGATRQLTHPGAEYAGDTRASFSHAGDRLAFIRHANPYSTGYLHVLELDQEMNPEGEPRHIETRPESHPDISPAAVDHPIWTADDSEIIFRYIGGPLARIRSDGSGLARLLGTGVGAQLQPAFSQDGTKLAFAVWREDWDIWRYDVRTDRHEALITSSGRDTAPAFSPDGSRISWQALRSGAPSVWVSMADGTDARPLNPSVDFWDSSWGAAWSPDGSRLAVDRRVAGEANIHVVSVDGGPMEQLTEYLGDDISPGWSHDGRFVYFTSNRDGNYRIWRQPADGGDVEPVTNTGDWPQVSPDGSFLFYRKSHIPPTEIIRKRLPDGPEETVISRGCADWEVHESGIYFTRGNGTQEILFYDFATGATTVAFELDTPLADLKGFSVSPDSQTVLYAKQDRGGSDLFLVDGFE